MVFCKVANIFTPIEFGGAEKVNLNLIRNINKEKFNVVPILLIRPWENENIFIKYLKQNKYEFYTIPVAKRRLSEGRDYFRVLRCLKSVYSILKRGKYDLLHTHGYFADMVGIPSAKVLGIPTISTCHGYLENDKTLKLYNVLDMFVLRYADRIVTVSDDIKEKLVRSKINEKHITVITNAVVTKNNNVNNEKESNTIRKKYRISEKELVVGYVGRLSEEKGIKYFIEAVRMLKSLDCPIKGLIIGDGPQLDILYDLVKKHGLEDSFIFTGFQINTNIWMQVMDIFVLPSFTEGTPMAMLEAMSFSLPVIATRVGGVPKILTDGVDGLLVEPGDSKALADSIIKLYKNNSLKTTIANNALKLVKKKYDVNEWCKKIEDQYHLLTNEKK